MQKLIIIFIFLICVERLNAQLFSSFKVCDRQNLERIIEKGRKIKDVEAANLFLRSVNENGTANQRCLEIVGQVLRAELASYKADYVNDESNRLYEKALKSSFEKENVQMQIWVSINYAYYLYSFGDYEKALPHFIRVGRLIESFPDEKMVFPSETYKKLGYFTGYIREYEKGIAYLERAEKYSPELSSETAALKDNIGLFSINNSDFDRARENFEKALQIAVKVKDTLRQAKVLGNMGDLYKKTGNFKKAIQLLHNDIYLSRKSGNERNTMFAMLRLTEAYLETGKLQEAKLAALNAKSIAQSKLYLKSSELEATELLLKIAQKTGNNAEELTLRRRVDSLNIALKISQGTNSISALNWEAQKQNFNDELNKERARVQKASFIHNGILLLCFVVLLAGFIFLIKQKNKSRKISDDYEATLKNLWDDKFESETKLQEASNSITAYVTYLSEKNQQIERLESEIKNIKSVFNTDENREALNTLLQSHLMTEENWNKFKSAFALEYPDFYSHLVTNYPELTEANWRIILLHKLVLSNAEIANLLGVTVEAVKKAKQRLKKKLNGEYEFMMGSFTVENLV